MILTTTKKVLVVSIFCLSASACFAQTSTAQIPTPVANSAAATTAPRVNKNLIVKTIAIGQIYERQRPMFLEYFKEIEQNNDFKNWKTPPHTAFKE